MERRDGEECLGVGLVRSKKYSKKNSSVCEGQKTIVRYLNTGEKKRVQFVNRRFDEMEKKKMMRISSPNENISTNEDKFNNNDEIKLGDFIHINSISSKSAFLIDQPLEEKPSSQLQGEFDLPLLNNVMNSNISHKSEENYHEKRKTTHQRRIKSRTITALILAVFMAGLIITLVGTMSSVKTGTINQKFDTELSTQGDEKPVILLSTKFKVPATNTFDEFSSGMTSFKVPKSRIKFAKHSE